MKVYVINLPEAKERKDSITKELARVGLEYEFVVPEKSDIIESDNEEWTTGANSLRLTTIKLIEQAVRDDEDMIWIWEDDALIDDFAFSKIKSQLEDLPIFDFIMLNYDLGSKMSHLKYGCLRKTINGVYRCTSYIINKRVYKDYLEALKTERPIDHSTKMLHKKRGRSFLVEPKPVYQEKGRYSYIRKKVVDY